MTRNISQKVLADLQHAAESGALRGNAVARWNEGVLIATFSGPGDVHQLLVPIETNLSNGYSFRLKIQNWRAVKYLALGYSKANENTFFHVKVPNPKQGEYFDFSVAHHDIIFRLQNNWQEAAPTEITSLRLYIKGEFEGQGSLHLEKASAWLEESEGSITGHENSEFNADLVDAIKEYWKACYPEFERQAGDYLKNGGYPIGSYPAMANKIPWGPMETKPITLKSPTTYRYSWHALNAVSVLILAHEQSSEFEGLIFSARELVADWIRESYFKADEDQKYCWYDHGTAERTLVLVVMYELGIKYKFDYRFMARLYHVLIKHSQLMESEAFYASHQRTRYHNHAWFQDIALMASAIALGGCINTQQWMSRAIQRLTDQFDILIKREAGYSIFTENSIGYHNGICRMVQFAAQVAALSGEKNTFSETDKALHKWSTTFVYPDGRMPAQGDTFRKPNPTSRENVVLPEKWQPNYVSLPESGYVVVKGGTVTCPWMFIFLATNLNRTHKHEDDLSFTLWLDGVEWLIDPSFYSHEYADDFPRYLRSAAAHNLLFIKNKNYSIDPVFGRSTFEASESLAENGERSLSIVGTSYAHEDHVVKRTLNCALDDKFFLNGTDLFSSTTAINSDSEGYLSFHFGDGVKAEREGPLNYVLTHIASNKKVHLILQDLPRTESIELKESFAGLGFLQKVDSTQLLVPVMQGNICSWRIYVSD